MSQIIVAFMGQGGYLVTWTAAERSTRPAAPSVSGMNAAEMEAKLDEGAAAVARIVKKHFPGLWKFVQDDGDEAVAASRIAAEECPMEAPPPKPAEPVTQWDLVRRQRYTERLEDLAAIVQEARCDWDQVLGLRDSGVLLQVQSQPPLAPLGAPTGFARVAGFNS